LELEGFIEAMDRSLVTESRERTAQMPMFLLFFTEEECLGKWYIPRAKYNRFETLAFLDLDCGYKVAPVLIVHSLVEEDLGTAVRSNVFLHVRLPVCSVLPWKSLS
jgi:hypothetical protein